MEHVAAQTGGQAARYRQRLVAALRAWRRPGAGLARRLLLVVLTALLLVGIIPGGRHEPVWHRALLFTGCTLLWEAGVMLVMQAMRRRLGADCFRVSPVLLAVAVALAAGPVTLAMAVLIAIVDGHAVALVPLFCQSLLLALMIGFARRGLLWQQARELPQPTDVERHAASVEHTPIPARGPSPGQFLARHAPAFAGGRLLALQAEDHYLRIHADRGSALVLMRLGDAVETLGSEAGWRVHRSFWVAADAPARAQRRGQGWELVLENGLTVPVSRSGARTLRPAWLDGQAPASASVTGSTAE